MSVRRQLCWFDYGLKPISGEPISNTMLVNGLERFWEWDRIAKHKASPNSSFDYSSGHNKIHSEIIPLTNIKDDTRDVIYLSSEEKRDDEP